ncbi:MAG: DsbA family oxidoreductase [Gammaproteobacteria bacterium]|nr:MAG: DsbA family oxidoreductase [Gammaproteobacteria bacterium]
MNLEIFSDLICPWCFIGKRRLDEALATGVGEGVNIIWRAYQLYPTIPPEGMDRKEFSRLRYRGADQSAARRQIEAEAERIGIDMGFERISRMPNTFQGHRLLHHARTLGVQHELSDRLFSAYFERGEDVGDESVLLDAAESVGLDRAATSAYLASEEGVDPVRREIERASAIGVTGVPCFVFAGAYALPGAQEPEVIAQVIERAKVKLAPSATA